MSRFPELTNAVRRRAVASAAAGLCIAFAAPGVAADATPAAAQTTASSTHSTTQLTAAAKKREFKRYHNPHGTLHMHRHHARVVFHGRAVDPDNTHRRIKIVLWQNHHRAKIVRTNTRHFYRVGTHLQYGKNRLVILAENIGKGTHHTKLGTSHLRRHGWVTSYHGTKRIAAGLLKNYGWGRGQMRSLINLWNRESGWSTTAANSSGAYGIPQALPGSKMSSAGPNWRYNARTQIRWGLGYIHGRYGSPNGAWAHSQNTGWY